MKKTALVPTYYKQFQCIGPACEDTCCKGWSITIDETTFKKYRKLRPSSIQKKIQKSIKRNRSNVDFFSYGAIKLDGISCPLLTPEGFCGVQAELGSDYLSRTCSVYPRQYNEVQKSLEISTSLSCPEAARLALLNEDGIDFEQVEVPSSHWDQFTNKQNNDLLWPLRIGAIRILQNRQASIENRLITLGLFLQKIEQESIQSIEQIEYLINQYEGRLTNEAFIAQLEHLPLQTEFQLIMISNLINERKLLSHQRFEEVVQMTVDGLQLSSQISNEEKVKIYENATRSTYAKFLKTHDYMLENYLVNHVFKELFPLDEKTLFESYRKMVTYFMLVKFHLVGVSHYKETMTEDDAIQVFQTFVRTTEHNSTYVQRALELLDDAGIHSIGHLVTLIRH